MHWCNCQSFQIHMHFAFFKSNRSAHVGSWVGIKKTKICLYVWPEIRNSWCIHLCCKCARKHCRNLEIYFNLYILRLHDGSTATEHNSASILAHISVTLTQPTWASVAWDEKGKSKSHQTRRLPHLFRWNRHCRTRNVLPAVGNKQQTSQI